MTKGTRANRGNIPAPDESPQRRRPSDLPRPARTAADNLADINEQLLTEREELRRQASEMAAFNEQLLARQEELLRRNLKLEQLRERAERAGRIARATESLARMAEDYPDPALRVAHTGQIRYMNPASYDLWRQWNPGDRQQVPPAIQELVATVYVRGEVIRREMTFGEHTYLITAVPTPPPADYVSIFAGDITPLKQAEEALRESNAELEHRARQLQKLTLELTQTEERERRRMAEILHDDLQQILAAAKFNLSSVRGRIRDDPVLQDTLARVEQMLKDAVEKSRSLSHELSPAVLHYGDLTETLGWLARQVQARYGLMVHVRVHGAVDVQSDILINLLYRAAQELVFNVVKHARVPEARMRVRRYGAWVCLSVSDRGPGFDPQELRTTTGYGLLSIRERVELLGGYMKIQSGNGKGSTFFIAVPDTPEDGEQRTEDRRRRTENGRATAERAPSSVLGPPSSVLRVLVADDHRIVRESLRLSLRDEEDIEIVGEAAHGREAVDLALQLEPDVVIMDVSMPLIDGDAATRQIKQRLPRTRVIALSTYNEPHIREKMRRAGAEKYVLKTASSEELLAALRDKPSDS